jgi:hypothetical protein
MDESIILLMLIPVICIFQMLLVNSWFNFFFKDWIENLEKSDSFILLKAGWLLSTGLLYQKSYGFFKIFTAFIEEQDLFGNLMGIPIFGLLALMVLMGSMQFILALLTYLIIRLMGKDLNIYMEVVNGRWSMSILWLAVYYSLLFLVSTLSMEALTMILPLGKLPIYH